ncbi:MAG: hypothetical protein ACHP9Z_05280 [Streptosporangiales bacterium]
MTTGNTLSSSPPATSSPTSAQTRAIVSWPPRRPWLCGAFFLAGAAQLITISALLSVDPLAATWSALLLAIAPAPLAAAAAFAPAPVARIAAVAGAAALVAGIVGGVLHTGLFFVPALVVLVIGGLRLWRADGA